MSTDTLDQATDAELNELFAHEVAGWIKSVVTNKPDGHPWMKSPPTFATDANAVLPYVGQFRAYNWDRDPDERDRLAEGVCVALINGPCAYAPTFARAAVIALIRARRAGK